MSFYPESVSKILEQLQHSRPSANADGNSVTSNLNCGAFVRFWIKVDVESDVVTDAGFISNACGFAIAASEMLARAVAGKQLYELGGLTEGHLAEIIGSELSGHFDRSNCQKTAIHAVRAAFADYRQVRLAAFNGDDALICTCFGISESTIDASIRNYGLCSVEEVANKTRAGAGCGSCRMLIQEMIDFSGQA